MLSDLPDDSDGELVFVYGTLRKAASNGSRMKGAERVASAMIRGRLLKIGWFPALVADPEAKTWVWGDVFRVKGFQLEAFREYEGLAAGAVEGQECRLIKARVHPTPISEWGWKVRLWEWTGPVDQAEVVASGDWLDVEHPKTAPLYTLIAGACALALPAFVASSFMLRGGGYWMEMSLGVACLLSPAAGWVAIHMATRRREKSEGLRVFVMFGLFLGSIPCALGLFALAAMLVRSIF